MLGVGVVVRGFKSRHIIPQRHSHTSIDKNKEKKCPSSKGGDLSMVQCQAYGEVGEKFEAIESESIQWTL